MEIRFLKIVGKTFFEQSEHIEEGSERESRIGEIMLSRKMFSRETYDDLKINFESTKMYKNEDLSSPNNSQSLVAVHAMKQLTKSEILKNISSFSDQKFLLKFLS